MICVLPAGEWKAGDCDEHKSNGELVDWTVYWRLFDFSLFHKFEAA